MALYRNINLLTRTAAKAFLIRSPIDQLNYEIFAKTNLLVESADGVKKPCIPIKKQEIRKEECFSEKIKTTPPSCGSKDDSKNKKPDNRSCEEILKKQKEDEEKQPDNRSCEEILKKQKNEEEKKSDNRSFGEKNTPNCCEDISKKEEKQKNQNCEEILKPKKDSECCEVIKKPELPNKSEKGTDSLCEEIFKNENVKNKDGNPSRTPAGVPGCSCSFVSTSSLLIPTFHNKHGFFAMKF